MILNNMSALFILEAVSLVTVLWRYEDFHSLQMLSKKNIKIATNKALRDIQFRRRLNFTAPVSRSVKNMTIGTKGRSSNSSVFLKGPTYVVPNSTDKVQSKRSFDVNPTLRKIEESPTRPKSAPASVTSKTRDSSTISSTETTPPYLRQATQSPFLKDFPSNVTITSGITPISSRTPSATTGPSITNTTTPSINNTTAAAVAASVTGTAPRKRFLWQEAMMNPSSSAFLRPPAPHLKYMKNLWVIEHPQEEDFTVRIPIKNETDTILESWSTSLPHIPLEKDIYLEANLKQWKDLDLAIKAQTSLSHCPLRTPFPMRVPKFPPRKKTPPNDARPPPSANPKITPPTTTKPCQPDFPIRSCLKSPDAIRVNTGDTRTNAKVRFCMDEVSSHDNDATPSEDTSSAWKSRPTLEQFPVEPNSVEPKYDSSFMGKLGHQFDNTRPVCGSMFQRADLSKVRLNLLARVSDSYPSASTLSRSSMSGKGKELKKGDRMLDVTRKEEDSTKDFSGELNTKECSVEESDSSMTAHAGPAKTCSERGVSNRTEETSDYMDGESDRIRLTGMIGSKRSLQGGRNAKSDNSMLNYQSEKVSKEDRRRTKKRGGRSTKLKRVEQKLDLQTSSQATIASKRSKGMQTNEPEFKVSKPMNANGDTASELSKVAKCFKVERTEGVANVDETRGSRGKYVASSAFQQESHLGMSRVPEENKQSDMAKQKFNKAANKKSQRNLIAFHSTNKVFGKDMKKIINENVKSFKKESVRDGRRRLTPSTLSINKSSSMKQALKLGIKDTPIKPSKKESFNKPILKKKSQKFRSTTKNVKTKTHLDSNSSSNSNSRLEDLFHTLLKYTSSKSKKSSVKNKQTRPEQKRPSPKKDLPISAFSSLRQDNRSKSSRTQGECIIKKQVTNKKSFSNRVTLKRSSTATTSQKTFSHPQVFKKAIVETKLNSPSRMVSQATDSKIIKNKRITSKTKTPAPTNSVSPRKIQGHIIESKSIASQVSRRKAENVRNSSNVLRKTPSPKPQQILRKPERKSSPPTKSVSKSKGVPRSSSPSRKIIPRLSNTKLNILPSSKHNKDEEQKRTSERKTVSEQIGGTIGRVVHGGKAVGEKSSIYDSLTCESLRLMKKARDNGMRLVDSLDSDGIDFFDPVSFYEDQSDTDVGIPDISSVFGDNTEISSIPDSVNKTRVRNLSPESESQESKKTKMFAQKEVEVKNTRNTSSPNKGDLRVIYSKKKLVPKSHSLKKAFYLSSSPNSTDISKIETISHDGSTIHRRIIHPLYDTLTGQFRPPSNTAHRAEEREFSKKVNVLKQIQQKRQMMMRAVQNRTLSGFTRTEPQSMKISSAISWR